MLRVCRVALRGAATAAKRGATVLQTRDVAKPLDKTRNLFGGVSFALAQGTKAGLVGPNGAGKSTLMRILSGRDPDYTGAVQTSPDVTIGILEQEPVLDDAKTVSEVIMEALADKTALLTRFDEVSAAFGDADADYDALAAEQAELTEQIDALDCWNLGREMAICMAALNCPPGDASVSVLSGGERRRVALCRLLLEAPSVLFLDEPTNHLDAHTVGWLENYLKAYRGAVVCVTHDRYFLQNVADVIIHIDRGRVFWFRGNYADWLEHTSRRMQIEQKQETNTAKALERELEWVRQPAGGRRKKSKARVKAYETLLEQAKGNRPPDPTRIQLPAGPRLGNVVFDLQGVTKTVDGRRLFENLTFRLERGAVLGVVGPNGAGKTTLLRMLMGEMDPDEGQIERGETVSIGYVSQSRTSLVPHNSVYMEITGGNEFLHVGDSVIHGRTYVASFNFKGTAQEKKVGVLSGGERNRVHLAKTLSSGCNVLMMDEPTNDLDIETLRSLEEALPDFPGSVVIVSHDRWFLNRLCTDILALDGSGHAEYFAGNYEEYEASKKRKKGS